MENQYSVNILFSPKGLGDLGYNDNTLYGIRRVCKEYGFLLNIHQPTTKEIGWECYKEWQEWDGGGRKKLFIFAGNEYEDLLRQNIPAKDDAESIIMFEVDKPIENVSCFYLDTYGAAYYAAVATGSYCKSAAVIGANNQDSNIKRIVDGFTQGFLEVKPADSLAVVYLSKEKGGGFDDSDYAFKMASVIGKTYSLLFPVAGGSNMGVMRYVRDSFEDVYTIGMDVEMSAYASEVLCSLVKKQDEVLELLISQWMDGKTLPAMTRYGLESGYVDVELSEGYGFLLKPYTEGLKEKAIKKENEHVEGN